LCWRLTWCTPADQESKARVSIARAAYGDSDIILLDDCLSAVDAHTGKALLEQCLMSGPMAGKTRVLATHALHVLDRVDTVYVMDEGRVVEAGTYAELRARGGAFARLMDEYGKQEAEPESEEAVQVVGDEKKEKKAGKRQGLMQAEERAKGQVSTETYVKYFRYAGSVLWAPLIIGLLVLSQAASGSCDPLRFATER
jgi:ATP-binding cassette subfamily C (CFTR/MRP) protein 1